VLTSCLLPFRYRDGEDPLQAIARATRRCHGCQILLGNDYVEAGGLAWCPDIVWCRYRSRLRLGVPKRGRNGEPGAWDMLQDELCAAGRRPGVIRRAA
jgi:hypothetical protein